MLTRITIGTIIALLIARALLAQTELQPWNPAEFAPVKSTDCTKRQITNPRSSDTAKRVSKLHLCEEVKIT